MGVGMMIEIIRSDAEIGEKIKSRRHMHTRLVLYCGTKVCRSLCIDEIADFEKSEMLTNSLTTIFVRILFVNILSSTLKFPNLRA